MRGQRHLQVIQKHRLTERAQRAPPLKMRPSHRLPRPIPVKSAESPRHSPTQTQPHALAKYIPIQPCSPSSDPSQCKSIFVSNAISTANAIHHLPLVSLVPAGGAPDFWPRTAPVGPIAATMDDGQGSSAAWAGSQQRGDGSVFVVGTGLDMEGKSEDKLADVLEDGRAVKCPEDGGAEDAERGRLVWSD